MVACRLPRSDRRIWLVRTAKHAVIALTEGQTIAVLIQVMQRQTALIGRVDAHVSVDTTQTGCQWTDTSKRLELDIQR